MMPTTSHPLEPIQIVASSSKEDLQRLQSLAHPPVSPLLLQSQLERIPYDIHSFSSHSAQYHPRNILVHKPTDQSSRWSSGSNNQLQFIMLRLEKPAIVQCITFGKYHKVHVCNLKEFKVYGGPSLEHMSELLHSGLRNDSESETFTLKFRTSQNVVFPVQYIKLVPLMAWGANFNFSIWYVELRGTNEPAVISAAIREYNRYRESEAIRLCLKHFRQRNLMGTFQELQQKTQLMLEHPILTELHQRLVLEGNFAATETMMQQAEQNQMFQDYIGTTQYKPVWKRIHAHDANGESPCMRGGHQMCINVADGVIYLFGGWNGAKDLSDFWAYTIKDQRWECLSSDTRRQGGPGPRSCHKICFDMATKRIYVLGRYVDPQTRPGTACESDFFSFDTVYRKWTTISNNTAAQGGPELIYDHQMTVDSDRQVLYVFGGRIISNNGAASPDNSYSGLFSYNIRTDSWKAIRTDPSPPTSGSDGALTSGTLRSRIGHSMLFNPVTRQLYIFAGQRHKDYLSDFYIYDIDKDQVTEMNRDYSKNGGPDAGFTQRATIDVALNEFYVFSGLMREKASNNETVNNSFWVYDIGKDKWARIYQNENTGEEYWSKMSEVEPCPRFAHQLVYDHVAKVQYLFGGNPGEPTNQTSRLDDFWSLTLKKPHSHEILRRLRFLIRQQQFKEMCQGNQSMEALRFLQLNLGECVNHEEESESLEFRNLMSNLLSKGDTPGGEDLFRMRTQLYEQLLTFFPESMKQPHANLIDSIPM